MKRMLVQRAVQDLLVELAEAPEFRRMARELERAAGERGEGRGAVRAHGLTATAKSLHAALLQRALRKPLFYVARSNREAEQVADLLQAWTRLLGEPAPVFIPAHDLRPYQGLSPHADIGEKRALGLSKIVAGQANLVVLPAAAAASRTQAPEFYRGLVRQIRKKDEVSLDELLEHLERVGYTPRDPVEMVGQYALRGGILDVFSPEARRPVRLELFGDDVESLREFDPATQRSVGPVPHTTILPLTEFPWRQGLGQELSERLGGHPAAFAPDEPFPGWEFLMPLLNPLPDSMPGLCEDAVFFLDEPAELRREMERLWLLLEEEFQQARQEGGPAAPPDQFYLKWEELAARWDTRPLVHAEELALLPEEPAAQFDFGARPSPRFHGNLPLCLSEIQSLLREEYRILLLTAGAGETERLAELFAEQGIAFHRAERGAEGELRRFEKSPGDPAIPACWIARGGVANGVVFPRQRLVILGNQDLFDTSEAATRPVVSRSRISTFLSDFRDLEPGDCVVHVDHGIGCYRGLKEITHEEIASEFMELEYQEGARLYVPLTRLDLVQKYRALEGARPPLDRLGGSSWARTKARVRKSTQEMAGELLKLYAARQLAEGIAFAGDDPWQREFEEAFEYEETPDQLKTIEDVRRDMERPVPMDRLVCGDVGYGKTEVAMRAAFRVAAANRQAAVLAPTTVLAFQHYETFRQRFAAFPIRIELLSRFRTTAQQKTILQDLELGKIDLVIGTHRLLSKDVAFHDLGLLIVDEEQRFGVRHKERLKAMKQSVDVLSLSATPIPRTLHMSLAGLRDMSVIETAPKDRLSIQTVVAPFSEPLIQTAIRQEVERGGQVYFVHNRIESLDGMASLVQKLVPQARIATAHGQMNERQLEKVMLGFLRQETNVLLATTIIENGLDIPLANTIVVNRADRLGLAELYQLRGRVGRSNRRAYAYLLVPPEDELTPLARRRLSALKEFSELGSGFRIAALDMELRGAGNLLGGEQHGHVNAVGFELYCQMMEQAVRELKGEAPPSAIATTINLGLNIRIPPSYIPEEHQRLRMYKAIGAIRSAEERADAQRELEDRYGALPPAVKNLLDYAALKAAAEPLWVQSIERKDATLSFHFHPGAGVDPARLMTFISRHPDAQFTPSGVLRVPVRDSSQNVVTQATAILQQLQAT